MCAGSSKICVQSTTGFKAVHSGFSHGMDRWWRHPDTLAGLPGSPARVQKRQTKIRQTRTPRRMAHDIQAALLALLPRVQRTSSAHAHLVRRAQGHVQCDGNLLQLGMHEIVQSGVQFTPFKRAWHAHNALSQEMHRQIGKHTSRTTQRKHDSCKIKRRVIHRCWRVGQCIHPATRRPTPTA